MYTKFRMPSIWREMDQLQNEMNRLLEYSLGRRGIGSLSFPAINIWTNEDGISINAELPGINPDELDISLTADTLTLSGQRQPDEVEEGVRLHRNERTYGQFSRSIQLPFMVDTNKVKADFKDGVLELTLNRAEVDKPKKIAVKSR